MSTCSNMPADGRLRRLARGAITWGPALALSAAIFWFSSRTGLGSPHLFADFWAALFGLRGAGALVPPIVQALDAAAPWIAHFTEYAALALAWHWALRNRRLSGRSTLLLAWLLTAAYALSDEFHQRFVPGRHSDWRDVATDMAGAAFALAILALIQRRRKRNGHK